MELVLMTDQTISDELAKRHDLGTLAERFNELNASFITKAILRGNPVVKERLRRFVTARRTKEPKLYRKSLGELARTLGLS